MIFTYIYYYWAVNIDSNIVYKSLHIGFSGEGVNLLICYYLNVFETNCYCYICASRMAVQNGIGDYSVICTYLVTLKLASYINQAKFSIYYSSSIINLFGLV